VSRLLLYVGRISGAYEIDTKRVDNYRKNQQRAAVKTFPAPNLFCKIAPNLPFCARRGGFTKSRMQIASVYYGKDGEVRGLLRGASYLFPKTVPYELCRKRILYKLISRPPQTSPFISTLLILQCFLRGGFLFKPPQ
jgi:hypothetical protein